MIIIIISVLIVILSVLDLTKIVYAIVFQKVFYYF